jgi:hypothetical protein
MIGGKLSQFIPFAVVSSLVIKLHLLMENREGVTPQ